VRRPATPLLLLTALTASGGGDGATKPLPPGTLTVAVTTTGVDLDVNGYTVRVDGREPMTVDRDGSRTVDELGVGAHTVTVGGVASNCAVDGGPTRTAIVRPAELLLVGFAVICSAREIAFASDRDGDTELYVVRSDGTSLRRLTTRRGRDMDRGGRRTGRASPSRPSATGRSPST